MPNFLTRLFSSGSSSSKRGSFHGSQSAINDGSRRAGAQTNIRGAASLENISSYYVNPKDLEKHKLHKASWEGNINKVTRHAKPDQLNLKDRYSRTPLHLAVARGHLRVVQHLVHEGAKMNAVDSEQRTPLVIAVLSAKQNPAVAVGMCRLLLSEGAESFINAVDVYGKNALHYAIEIDNEELVSMFLSVPACDPNFRDREQMTPLHLAVKHNKPTLVYHLLSDEYHHQSDPNLINQNGQTPLHIAAQNDQREIIRMILQAELEEPCDPTIVDAQQLTAYQIAQANHHDVCANIIQEYQESWRKLTPRRDTTGSINEQEINPTLVHGTQQFEDDSDSETNDDSSSVTTNSRPTNQYSNRTAPLPTSANKPEGRSLADMIKSNPLQPDIRPTSAAKPSNNQGLSSLFHSIPLQPNEATSKPGITTQQRQPNSLFSDSPSSIKRIPAEQTSTSTTINKLIPAANLIVGQTTSTAPSTSTISAIIGATPQAATPNTSSWSPYSPMKSATQSIVTQAKRADHWDQSSTTQSEDDDSSATSGIRTPPIPFAQISTLNGTAMFTTTTTTPTKAITNDYNSEDDSIEAAVKSQSVPKASDGIHNLVNKQIGNNYVISPPTSYSNGIQSLVNKQILNPYVSPSATSFPEAQSPKSEHSTWTSSSIGMNKDSTNKGISSIVQQQPLLIGKKSNEPTWDDSRPLSADLKRTSIFTDSSDDSDFDDDHKSATIVKSPYTTPTLSNLVQQNIHPTESKQTGVENLTKIIDTIMHLKPAAQKQLTPPSTINKLVSSPLIKRSESSSSSNASSMVDDTLRSAIKTGAIATTMTQQLHGHSGDPQSWSEITSSGHDFQLITRNYSNEMAQQGQPQTSRTSIHHEFNNLRSSMSSSTSSIQNNIERLSELKEDIKEIERKQENSFELKRQLKDMEIKKNNFEALYKKNDQLLRETETKLEKEINEKQRLEWTTKTLNMELKSVQQRLKSLEDEKDILNQRCMKLKEERDNYDEKLRIHQANSLQSVTTGVLREEDIDKIKIRHREEMKLLSAENEDLHQRTRQLQSDLQLHRESLDVTIRYKIDLEKALEEKTFLQHELDRLKHEKDFIEQEKVDYKTKSDSLQEEIRILLLDRSKIEQKLNNELQEQIKQRQRSTDDSKKYKSQIEQLNMKLGDAEARLLVLQTQNEALIASKDREIKNGFETLTQRLNLMESEKHNAEQRYHNEHKEIDHKQQHVLHEPLVIVTSGNGHQHSPSSPCVQCDTLRRSFEQEREYRLQTEKDNERLRDVVSRQSKQQEELTRSFQQKQENEHLLAENSKQIRTNVERVVNHGLDQLRDDLGKLLSNYNPPNNFQQQAQLHSQIETMRQFYEEEFRKQQQGFNVKSNNESKSPIVMVNGYRRRSTSRKHDEYDHSPNGSLNCSICSNSRLLKERLDNAIDTSLADQRIQTIKQIPILPRQTSPLLTTNNNNNNTSFVDLLRKRYYI